ncbi:MAG: nitrilase-related carbon-nitrogen hydrolase [Caldilineaceae bacterium]
MFSTKQHPPQLVDRFSWGWLVIGAALLPFTNYQTVLPIAAWLAPVFLLRFVRTQRAIVGLPVIAFVYFGGMTLAFGDMLPPPMNYFVGVLGMVAVAPYAADRLLSVRLTGVARTLLFPLTITIVDWLVSLGPLGAATTAAYSQYGNLALMQVVSVTGIWGLAFLIAWLAPVANDLWEHSADWRTSWPALALFGGVLLVVLFFGNMRLALATTTAPTVRVAGLTHNKALWDELPLGTVDVAKSSADVRAELRPIYARILDDMLLRTQREARAGAELVVWSEAAAFMLKEDEAATLAQVQTLARQEGIYLQAAFVVILQTQQFPYGENRVILVDPAGAIVWDYYKTVHPLGDAYVFAPGPGVIPAVTTPFGRLMTVNCFDADYPRLLRQVGQAGADLLLVPSHDWAQVRRMHVQIHAFRAIENGVSLLRPTGDGISLATDYLGRVLATADDFATTQPALVLDIPMQHVPTLYARFGDYFVYLCMAGWLMVVVGAFWPPHEILLSPKNLISRFCVK